MAELLLLASILTIVVDPLRPGDVIFDVAVDNEGVGNLFKITSEDSFMLMYISEKEIMAF